MSSVKRSLTILGSQRLLSIAIGFFSSVIIARLLTPQEIGIYSVCVSVIALAHVFREFGVGNYLIQERELTRDRIRASLTILLVFAWSLAIILYLGRGLVADFYNNQEIKPIFSVLALNFLMIPISSPVLSILRRNLEFGKMAIINISSNIVLATVSVTMAMTGHGPISLAWGAFGGIVSTITLSSIFRPPEVPWLPGIRDIRRVLTFGSKSSLATLVNEAGNRSPDLIIGRILSLGDVGLYSRANGFCSIMLDQISMLLHSLLFPTFSNESREGKDVIRNYKERSVMVSAVLCPGLCFFGFTAKPLILLLYGDQWTQAAPLATIICFSALIYVPYTLTGSLLMAHGRVGFAAKSSLIVQSAKILTVIAGSMLGLIYVPIFGSAVFLGRFLVHRYAMKKFYGVPCREILRIHVRSYLVAAITMLPVIGLSLVIPADTSVHIIIPAYLVTGAIFWLAGLYLTRHRLTEEINIIFKSMTRKLKLPHHNQG